MIAFHEHFAIVAEGSGWVLVDKGAPLIVHSANNRTNEPSLLSGLQQFFSYEIANGAKLSLINRLDRETSGLVLVALNKETAGIFGKAMERREIKKSYQAIVHGWADWEQRIIDQPILSQREVQPSSIWLKQMVHPTGKPCRTKFVRERCTYLKGNKVSLLSVYPETGRMHQIRVHAACMGHSLVGDKIYGDNEEYYLQFIEQGMTEKLREQLLIERHALHASGMSWDLKNLMDSLDAKNIPDKQAFQVQIPLAKDLASLI